MYSQKTISSIKEVKSNSKRTKGTPPSSVTKTGTYFSLINVYFCQIHCDDIVKLGGVPTVAELDCCQFLHKNVYDGLWQYTLTSIIPTLDGMHFNRNIMTTWESQDKLHQILIQMSPHLN